MILISDCNKRMMRLGVPPLIQVSLIGKILGKSWTMDHNSSEHNENNDRESTKLWKRDAYKDARLLRADFFQRFSSSN